jgi:thiamine biosynthesis lipoprotein
MRSTRPRRRHPIAKPPCQPGKLLRIALAGLGLLLVAGCSGREQTDDLELLADALHTTVSIRIPRAAGDPEAVGAIRAAIAEIRRVEKLLNYYDPESKLSRLNRERELSREEMGEEMWALLHQCRGFFEATGGAFDVSVGPLIQLWRIGTDQARLPTSDEIENAKKRTGLGKVVWGKNRIRLPEGMELQLGGILKGYALDRAAAVLREQGIGAALLNAGGDVYALGERAPSQGWHVGIRHPRHPDQYFGRLEVSNAAVATSGDYFQYFEIEEKRYHHILDPRTGFPSEACVSATIIADHALQADAWATAAVVLGQTMSALAAELNTADSSTPIEYLLVLPDGAVDYSKGLPLSGPVPRTLKW